MAKFCSIVIFFCFAIFASSVWCYPNYGERSDSTQQSNANFPPTNNQQNAGGLGPFGIPNGGLSGNQAPYNAAQEQSRNFHNARANGYKTQGY